MINPTQCIFIAWGEVIRVSSKRLVYYFCQSWSMRPLIAILYVPNRRLEMLANVCQPEGADIAFDPSMFAEMLLDVARGCHRVDLMNSLQGRRIHVAALLERCDDVFRGVVAIVAIVATGMELVAGKADFHHAALEVVEALTRSGIKELLRHFCRHGRRIVLQEPHTLRL